MLIDYQRVMVDNLIEDINTFVPLTDGEFQAIQDKFESRIVAYDQERKDQIVRDGPRIMDRVLREVL